MAKAQSVGINWSLFSKIFIAAGIALFLWALTPAALCAAGDADQVGLGGLSEDGEFHDSFYGRRKDSTDSARATHASGFLSQFFGTIPDCYKRWPLQSQEPWKTGGAAGGIGLGILLHFIAREAYKKQVRDSAKRRSR